MAKVTIEWSSNVYPGTKVKPNEKWLELHVIERLDFIKDTIEVFEKMRAEHELELANRFRGIGK